MPPTFALALVGAAIAGAAGFGLAWRLQSATINEMELQSAQTRIAAGIVARQAIDRATSNVIQAQNAATDRMVVLHRDAYLARSGLDGLRTSTDSAMRAAATSLDACNTNATTLSVIQSQCTGQLQALASSCDGHASDVKLLQDAWPK